MCGENIEYLFNLLLVCVINLILSVVIIFGNLMIFLVIFKIFGLWINFNFFIVLFVVVDFFVGLVMNLFYVVKVGMVVDVNLYFLIIVVVVVIL